MYKLTSIEKKIDYLFDRLKEKINEKDKNKKKKMRKTKKERDENNRLTSQILNLESKKTENEMIFT